MISILYPVCFIKINQKEKSLVELTTRLTRRHDLILLEITRSYELFVVFNSVEFQQNLSASVVYVMECYNSLHIHGVPNTTKADF